jgi:hypothetical protein
MATRGTELYLDLIPPDDLGLLRRCATGRGLSRATVKRFRRFGRSGTDLYLLSDTDHRSDAVYVVKLGGRVDIEKEGDRTGAARSWIGGQDGEDVFPVFQGDRGALCVSYKADGDDVVELQDLFGRATRGDVEAGTLLLSNLSATYEILFRESHRPSRSVHDYTYLDLFDRYRRKRHNDRVTELFNSRQSPLRLQTMDVTSNPLERIDELLARPIKRVLVSFVHGDLHLSNIVLRDREPALVDFAWSEMDDHACKDFVMVESSLRFMLFPRAVHPAVVEEVDTQLNAEWSVEAARRVIQDLPASNSRVAVEVMLDGVERVRQHADVVGEQFLSPDEWHREYFTSLYLVLAGQQRFDTFPLVRVIANLSQIGDRYVWA